MSQPPLLLPTRRALFYSQKELTISWRQQHYAWALLFLVGVWPGWAQNMPPREGTQGEPESVGFLSQLQTVAVCGHPRCDCGPLRQISRQNGPCAVASATGRCEVGSGECCLCAEATATSAVCSNSLCDCGGASVVTKVGAPCTVTSLQGRCEVSNGECCLCASK
jgi:hypothetical protein